MTDKTTSKMRFDKIAELARELEQEENTGLNIEKVYVSDFDENAKEFSGTIQIVFERGCVVDNPFTIHKISDIVVLADRFCLSTRANSHKVSMKLGVLSPWFLTTRAKALTKLNTLVDKAMAELEEYDDDLDLFDPLLDD